MLAYFLFFFYLFSGIILMHIIIRRKIFPFTIYHTASIFLFKIFMGCLYGWVFLHFYSGDDTWNYFAESKDETNLLLMHPIEFFKEFSPVFSLEITHGNHWDALFFYIVHFERWFIIKGLAILNLLTGKNYYTDVLLFEFLTALGPLLLFKMLARLQPSRIGMNFLLIFFVPSVVFWCSGIRAESLLLLFTVLILYNSQEYALCPRWRRLPGIGLGFLGLLLIRYQFLIVLLPAVIAFGYSVRKKTGSPVYFNRIYLLLAFLFMASLFLPPAYQLSHPLQQAQESFFNLHGNTRYALDSLQPGPISFLKVLPQSIANTFLRPYPWEGKNLLQSGSSVDILLLLTGVLFFSLSPERKKQVSFPLYWFFLFYGITQLITIGYTVPFPGAIVRYRSYTFLFLFLFLFSGNPLLQQKLRFRIFNLH
jgi:hypothetical protein